MSDDDRARWDQRYSSGEYGGRTHPSDLLAEWAPQVVAAVGGRLPRALDLACGMGRNARYLAALGFQVDAVDISGAGLARAAAAAEEAGVQPGVRWIQHDLDDGLPADLRDYHLIVLVRYVNDALLRALPERLLPGGWLICEEHLHSDAEVIGPSNPAFRVAPGALTAATQTLEVVLASEGIETDPDGRPAALARLVARRRG
jgi:SAM-dependent methyltransferase